VAWWVLPEVMLEVDRQVIWLVLLEVPRLVLLAEFQEIQQEAVIEELE
jgi:hypothetical protein